MHCTRHIGTSYHNKYNVMIDLKYESESRIYIDGYMIEWL